MVNNPFHIVDLSKYSFLVTGGAGFIGSNLIEYLLTYNAGKVVCLDNLETGSMENLRDFNNHPSFTFFKGDIANPDDCLKACDGIDIVFHQAALGSVPRSINDPINTNRANIDGFLNMLVAAKDLKVKRFIYAASSSTYGDSKILPKKEDIIGKPLSPYAVTKYVNELYANVFSNIYGIETIGLRYFNVFGPRQNPDGAYAAVIPKFIYQILNNTPPLIDGTGEQTRDFTFVENVIQANIKAAFVENKNAVNQVYNVAVGERTSINNLFEYLVTISNQELRPKYKEGRKGDVKDSLADISKAQNLLDYKPTVSFKEGLKKTFSWFREIYQKKDF